MAGGFRSFKSEKQRMKVMAILEKRSGGGSALTSKIQEKEKLHLDQQTVNILKTQKRRMAVLDKLRKPNVVFSDNEVQHITNSLNRLKSGGEDNEEFALEAKSLIARHPKGVMIDEEFTKKGLEFLTRTNIQKQLDENQKEIIENFKEFHLAGWFDDSNEFRSFFKPEFTVISNNDRRFDYTVGEDVTKITITG